ncbi:TPA: hypothetical protein ACTYDV_001737 [Serratia marcescens]
MIIGFGNNVVSSLAADITATQTTIQVMPGAGALFAGLLTYDYANDSNPLKVYAKITLTDAKETVFEVCHLTAVNNDMLTVVRGQEGTAAKGWSLNDVIANFATRGSENQFVQIEQLQSGHYTSAVAGGTANGLTLALPATFFLNGSTEWTLKTPILIYPILNNTGASTLQLTMGGRVMGTYPLVKGSNTALRAGDIVAKNPFLAVFNADQGRFIVLNPTTDVGSVRSVNAIGPDAGGNVALPLYGLGMGPQHKDDAYSNIAQFYRVNGTSVSSPGNGVYGVVSLPCDGGPSGSYLAIQANGIAYIGWSNTPANGVLWTRVFTAKNPPTAAGINAADVRNNFAARMGVSRVLTGNNAPTSAGVWSVENSTWAGTTWGSLICTTNSSNLSTTPGNQKFLHYLQISHEAGGKAGLRTAINVNGTFSGWDRVYTTGYKPTAADVGAVAKTGDTMSGALKNSKEFQSTGIDNFRMANSDIGSFWRNDGNRLYLLLTNKGDPLGSFNDLRPFMVDLASGTPSFGSGIHIDGKWPAITTSTGTTWHPDGNVQGTQWGGYLSNWLNSNISNAQNGAQNWAYQNLVQNVRLSGRINQPDTGGQVRVPDGCVFTGVSGANYDPSIWASYSYIQVLINGTWRNIGTS